MKNSIITILAILFCLTANAQLKEIPQCVHREKTALFFPAGRAAQNGFYAKLDSLIAGNKENINIWQVGGSHIQGGVFPYQMMSKFQTLAGRGERGFLFPRQLAGTHPDPRYRITAKGKWFAPMLTRSSKEPKPEYGITGFAARTDSIASLGLNIDPKNKGLWHFKQLRVLGYATSERAYPEVVVGSKTIQHYFDPLTSSYMFDLPKPTDSVLVRFVVPKGESFVFNGFQPITGNKGVNYFASGVNGARVTAWTEQCAHLDRDMKIVKPDLAIFGLGINDSACDSLKFDPEKFKNNYRELIAKVHKVSPDCALIFITNNDSFRYSSGGMVYNVNAEEVRQAMVELAMEYNAGVWDLYGLMGGANSVHIWQEEKLIAKDKLHFTAKGYRLLGDLLFEAIYNDWKDAGNENPENDIFSPIAGPQPPLD